MLPYLSEVQNNSKKYTVAFRGLNYGEGTQDGEFAETHNLSTDQYPCITQRAGRVRDRAVGASTNTAICSKGHIFCIVGQNALYNGELVGTVTDGKKQLATVGNYIVIFPDKKYYKVPKEDEPVGELQDMEIIFETTHLYFDTSKISMQDNFKKFPFKKGDSITIENASEPENCKEEIIIRGATDYELTFDANTFTVSNDLNYTVTLKRTVPPLDFVCEHNYRLWGTHGNTIYASKYSDPLNFKSFEGLAGDSYYIDVASEGEFTGCIPYSSHICFFKENTLHKLYGTKPSNYQITTANVYGVQNGCERSMQIVNEQLLYKGVGGVYAYTGGVPELISEKFGNRRYSDAVACCDGEKYYISMKHGDSYNMFAYDVAKNLWLREDDTHAVDMTFHDGKVYFVDQKGYLRYIDKTKTVDTDVLGKTNIDIEWSATFCTMHETMNERKGYSKFHLRMDLSAGAWLAVDIKTDNDLQWKQVYTTHNEKAKTVSIPIIPTRCDSIDIRLRGKGKCTIKSFIREFTVGSDV
jgi:hypothetical protein